MFVAALTVLHYTIVGMTTGRGRAVYTQEFMDEKFGKEHEEAIGSKIGAGGFPDTGNGRYSMELNYADWMKMVKHQRAHLNYFENILQILFYVLAGGLHMPTTFAIMGGIYLLGRIMFTIGYLKSPRGRFIGGILVVPLQFAFPIVTVVSLVLLGIESNTNKAPATN